MNVIADAALKNNYNENKTKNTYETVKGLATPTNFCKPSTSL